jgi:predicted ATPase
MSLTSIAISGYRSVQRLEMIVDRTTVLVGRNGVGKTNLYKALYLLQAAANGTVTREIAAEGGIESVFFAGARRQREPMRLSLKADLSDVSYTLEIGAPGPSEAALNLEPRIKEERLDLRGANGKPANVMSRQGPSAWLKDVDGKRQTYANALLPSETALSTFRDGARYPALDLVRRELLGWRFYHTFRTDPGAPVRQPCLAVATPTLAPDGNDLAAVLATVYFVKGDAQDIEEAVEAAFPGSRLDIAVEKGRASFALRFPDQPRSFEAVELSDGTLRYLCLVGALCSYRLPAFIALNEPEASLHPDLLPALARLIAKAGERTRIWIVTHSETLATALAELTGSTPRHVEKKNGATVLT